MLNVECGIPVPHSAFIRHSAFSIEMVVYSPRYELDLGAHVWPTAKYRLIAERVGGPFREPSPCSWDTLALVHTPEYLHKVRTGTLSPEEIRTLELPQREELADGFRLMTGGTCETVTLAMEQGSAVHLGGGLHHAFADHGEGFCLFNDVAVAVRAAARRGIIRRAAVIDCDVHHGNGTAFIFENDPSVFTFSIHQQHNYPMFKPRSDLDIGLRDGAGDAEYLDRLREALPIVAASAPELIVYLAGADPYREDRLGGLALSMEGLRERDRLVLDAARARQMPIAVVLAGGYALDVADTVAIHVATLEAALKC
jgi:acetoin utilization deacetylase AcuC-like enzyme